MSIEHWAHVTIISLFHIEFNVSNDNNFSFVLRPAKRCTLSRTARQKLCLGPVSLSVSDAAMSELLCDYYYYCCCDNDYIAFVSFSPATKCVISLCGAHGAKSSIFVVGGWRVEDGEAVLNVILLFCFVIKILIVLCLFASTSPMAMHQAMGVRHCQPSDVRVCRCDRPIECGTNQNQ